MILRRSHKIIALSLAISFFSCQKEEIPIAKQNPGDFLGNTVEIGSDYANQIYFDLGTNSVVKKNLKTDWDLAFESAAEGWRITLNSGRGMAAYQSDLSFSELNSTADAAWNWDTPTGNLDSTAIGNWTETLAVYLIDLGYDENANHLGYRKIQFISVNETNYTFLHGNLASEDGELITFSKNSTNLMTFFSFETGAIEIAPPNATYDLVFTQYTHVFHEPTTPYLVTGVLLNRFETTAIRYHLKPFEEINRDDVLALDFSQDLNQIGYDWKFYNFEEGQYVVDPTQVFIIQTNDGFYYKFRFTGFYNEFGVKGFPSFEFQGL